METIFSVLEDLNNIYERYIQS